MAELLMPATASEPAVEQPAGRNAPKLYRQDHQWLLPRSSATSPAGT